MTNDSDTPWTRAWGNRIDPKTLEKIDKLEQSRDRWRSWALFLGLMFLAEIAIVVST